MMLVDASSTIVGGIIDNVVVGESANRTCLRARGVLCRLLNARDRLNGNLCRFRLLATNSSRLRVRFDLLGSSLTIHERL